MKFYVEETPDGEFIKAPTPKGQKEYRYTPTKIPRGRELNTISSVKSFSIIDHKAYRYLLDNKKIVTRAEVENYVDHGKIISEFYQIIAEKIVEATGGVFIEGLGYFGIVQEFSKRPSRAPRFQRPKSLNLHTDRKKYNIAFVPIEKTNNLKAWVFDYTFTRALRSNLCKALKAGKKYTFNPGLFYDKIRNTKAKDF